MGKKLHIVSAVLIALLVAVGILFGYIILNINNSDADTTKESVVTESVKKDMHMHQMYEVPPDLPKPEITELIIMKDKKAGWNLEIKTKNFIFTPEKVNEDIVDGEGHAHLYIDGKKITRLYSSYYYISGYEDGVHDVKVTLNTNDHKDYSVNGIVIEESTKIIGNHDHTNEPDNHGH